MISSETINKVVPRWAVAVVMASFPLGTSGFVTAAELTEPVAVDSRVHAVTVFQDRALVTRRARVECRAGFQTVRFAPVPAAVEPDSVAVRGGGAVPLKLYGARVVRRQLAVAADPRVQQLEEAIRKIERRIQVLHDTQEILDQEREFLNSIKAASSAQIGKDLVTKQPNPQDLAGILAFLDQGLLENARRRQEAGTQREDLEQELDRLRRELAQLVQRQHREEMEILVDVEAAAGGQCDLDVSYRLPGATWRPVYEARCDTASSSLSIASYGMVRQWTGEDWGDVELTLSTAQPSFSGRMPELDPWYLRPWEEPIITPYASRAVSVEMKQQAMLAMGAVASAPTAQEAEAVEASVESHGPSVVYRLPRAESVPADGQPRKVSIGQAGGAVELAYETTPKLAPHAYLRAQMTLEGEAVYLPGLMQVFVDGAFVSTSSLDLTVPGQTLDLFLGVDERIRIGYKQRQAKGEVSVLPGWHGRSKTTDYEYAASVENYRGSEATIWLTDRIPVSQHDAIRVENVRMDPQPTEAVEEKPGVHRWKLVLPAGETREVVTSYRVRHPLEMKVQGL